VSYRCPPPSIVCPSSITFNLNDFFSKTTALISTKFGRKDLKGMGIQVYANQGAGPYLDPKRGKIW